MVRKPGHLLQPEVPKCPLDSTPETVDPPQHSKHRAAVGHSETEHG